jgi:polysaccharide biosynthesis transport protein
MNQVNLGRLSATPEKDAGYQQILKVLLRRWLWVAMVLAGSIALAGAATLRQAPSYQSSMDLLIEPNYRGTRENNQENQFADTNVEADARTQINLMQSSDLLRRVMRSLQSQYREFDPNQRQSVQDFRNSVLISQVASPDGQKTDATKIVRVAYTSNDPNKTLGVLRELKKVYLAYNLEQQRLRLERGLSFINHQLPQIQAKVKDSETALSSFRRDQELVDPEVQAKARGDVLNRLQEEKRLTSVQIRELQSQVESLQQQVSLSPQSAQTEVRLSQSTRYQQLLAELQKIDLAIEQQRTRFKDNSPLMESLLEQRQRQLGLLQVEAQRITGQQPSTADASRSSGQLTTSEVTRLDQLGTAQTNLRAVQARYAGLLQTESQLREEMKRFPQLLEAYGRLQPEVELNQDTFKSLLEARQNLGLQIARGGFGWQVVEEPQVGTRIGPNLRRNMLLGAIAGLFLGGIAAFLRDSADDAVYSSEDLKQQSTVPLLGTVPSVAASELQAARPLRRSAELIPQVGQIMQYRPFRESLDSLYQNIQLLAPDVPYRSLVVTSALSGEGKSTLALGLAMSAARLHQRVLLIDGDLRSPSLHKFLNLPNDQGLATLLSTTDPLPQHLDIQDANLRSNISILTAGPIPTDPAKLLSSQRMRDVIAMFEQRYDLVIIDAPPVLGAVDVVLAARCCSAVMLVGRMGQITRSKLSQAIASLNKLNLIGVIANSSPQSHLVNPI